MNKNGKIYTTNDKKFDNPYLEKNNLFSIK